MGDHTSTVLAALCGWALLLPTLPPAANPPPDSARIARLAALGRLWATVGVFHPSLARRPIDWDSALVATIPRVNAARTAAAYQEAVASMLAVLADPATRIERVSTDSSAAGEEPNGSWLPDSVWLIRLRAPAALADFYAASTRFTAMAEQVGSARGVVFDVRLRAPLEDATSLAFVLDDSGLLRRVFKDTLQAPSSRARMYAGLPPYNRRRRHSTLGYLSPVMFELRHAA